MSDAPHELGGEVARVFAQQRVSLTEQQQEKFARYLELLERWNRAVSLTSITDRAHSILRHFVEPARAVPFLAGAGPHVLDAGSGGGCPGLPLKILDPDRAYRLVEANGRKATFLREVIDALELEGVEVLEGRLDELIDDETLVGPIHVLTARGWTSGWGSMLGLVAKLMVPGGRAMILTGDDTLRALQRNLGPGRSSARANDPKWSAAAAAGWEVRRAQKMKHLERGYLVSLELPSAG